jgi:hypothetical protein
MLDQDNETIKRGIPWIYEFCSDLTVKLEKVTNK